MYIKYSYWIFRNRVSKKDIAKIKNIAKETGYGDALTSTFYTPGRQNFQKGLKASRVRDTDVAFSSDSFLYDIFVPLVYSANNQSGWKYDVDYFEGVQIARYRKNQHYSWHEDGRA